MLELQGPLLPECAAYVWGWYGELANTAAGTGMGPPAITHAQIESWARLRGLALLGYEIDWLFALDACRQAEYDAREKPTPGGSSPHRSPPR